MSVHTMQCPMCQRGQPCEVAAVDATLDVFKAKLDETDRRWVFWSSAIAEVKALQARAVKAEAEIERLKVIIADQARDESGRVSMPLAAHDKIDAARKDRDEAEARAEKAEAERDELRARLEKAEKQVERYQCALEKGPGYVEPALYEETRRERNAARVQVAVLRGALAEVLNSASPHPVEHPAMTRAWKKALAALADTNLGADWVPRAELERAEKVSAGFSRWPMVFSFARAMVRKLDHHAPKKGGREGWLRCQPENLVRRIEEETAELAAAVDLHNCTDVLDEAADVANMAMMVADAAGALPLVSLSNLGDDYVPRAEFAGKCYASDPFETARCLLKPAHSGPHKSKRLQWSDGELVKADERHHTELQRLEGTLAEQARALAVLTEACEVAKADHGRQVAALRAALEAFRDLGVDHEDAKEQARAALADTNLGADWVPRAELVAAEKQISAWRVLGEFAREMFSMTTHGEDCLRSDECEDADPGECGRHCNDGCPDCDCGASEALEMASLLHGALADTSLGHDWVARAELESANATVARALEALKQVVADFDVRLGHSGVLDFALRSPRAPTLRACLDAVNAAEGGGT